MVRTRFATLASRYIRWDSPVGWFAAAVAALGAVLFPRTATWWWVTFFLITAAMCGSSYFERCGRVHCRITGPLFLVCAGYLTLVQLDAMPFIGNGWFVALIFGTVALAFLAEAIVGPYSRAS